MAEPKATLTNWRTAPHNRWAFHHVRELVPSADIPNEPRKVRALPGDLADFAKFRGFIDGTETDGLLVLHRGRIVFEHYGHGMTEETPHILMSVSKSMLGLLFHLLRLDAERRVGEILPQLEGTAYRGAKLRVGQWVIETQAGFLDDLEANGDAQAWAAGDLVQYYPGAPMRYRNQWYLLDGEAPLAFGMGIHGQNLFVDRANEIVIAKLSSQALPLDAKRMALTMQAVSQIRNFLSRR